MEIIRTATYATSLKRLGKLGATDGDILAMENAIAVNIAIGDVIPGTGGLRKVRFGFGGRGKRGGGRNCLFAGRLCQGRQGRPVCLRTQAVRSPRKGIVQ